MYIFSILSTCFYSFNPSSVLKICLQPFLCAVPKTLIVSGFVYASISCFISGHSSALFVYVLLNPFVLHRRSNHEPFFSCIKFTPFIVSGCVSASCSMWSDLIHIPILPATVYIMRIKQSDQDASCPPISGKKLMGSTRKDNHRPQKGKRKAGGNASEQKRKKKSKMARETHSSSAPIIKCRPASLCQVIDNLNEVQREAVKSIGFGGLLAMHDLKYIPWGKMNWFFTNFNPTSRVLSFSNNKTIVLTVDDVHDVLLLPRNDGNNVLLFDKDDKRAIECLDEFKNRYGLTSFSHSKASELLRGSSFADGGDDFKRLFVLYSLSIFLTPTLNQVIDLSTFRSLIDVDRISTLDWSKYVLEKLCTALKSYPMRYVGGCLLIIPLLYLHRFMWLGVAEPSTLPLIQHWTSKKLKDRLDAECSAGSVFGVGNWVDSALYPVSAKSKSQGTKASDAAHDNVHEEGGQFITYKLPVNEKSDLEIRKMAKDRLHESFLLLQRDLSVITHMHLERLRKLRKNKEKKEETICHLSSPFATSVSIDENIDIFNDSEFHRHIDQLVEQFQNMKRSSKQSDEADKKISTIRFDLLTPTLEEKPNIIVEVCKKVKGEEEG